MSQSDPNNPYAQQPQQPQQPIPQYPSYPQQQQPQQPQPYGYPGYPGQGQPPYGGLVGPPTSMPGKVTGSRVMMFIAGGLQALFSLLIVVVVAASDDFRDGFNEGAGYEFPKGAFIVIGVVCLLHAVWGLVVASMFGKGRGGVRVGAIVWSSFLILFGLVGLPIGILWIALGIICVVFLANRDSGAWFSRPRT